MSSESAQRLAAAVKARRIQLGLSQIEVGHRGGPSNSKMTDIENAALRSLTRATAQKIDEGLRWVPGSALAVWDGYGDAEPLTEADRVRRMISAIESARMPAEDKAHMLRLLNDELTKARGSDDEKGAS